MNSQKGNLVLPIMGIMIWVVIVYVFVKGIILEPAQESSENKLKAFENALFIQRFAHMKYYPADVSTENLEKRYDAGPYHLSVLNMYAKRAGHWFDTGYPENTRGHALSLSNAILIGDPEPRMLPREKLNELEEIEQELRDDANGWF